MPSHQISCYANFMAWLGWFLVEYLSSTLVSSIKMIPIKSWLHAEYETRAIQLNCSKNVNCTPWWRMQLFVRLRDERLFSAVRCPRKNCPIHNLRWGQIVFSRDILSVPGEKCNCQHIWQTSLQLQQHHSSQYASCSRVNFSSFC